LTPLVVATISTLFLPGIVKAEAGLAVDYENLTLSSGSHWNGADDTYDNGEGQYNTFQSGGAVFNNYHEYYYEPTFYCDIDYWEGCAYSNQSDIGSLGFIGQFTAMGSGVSGKNGAGGSANYALANPAWTITPTATLDSPGLVSGAYFTNTAYAYGSMLSGDSFAKKFGGANGNDPDWFKLTITGKDATDAVTNAVDFYLADFRSANNAQDYIIHDWTFVDLTSLGSTVKSLEFGLSSSDSGQYGMNTPAYFAMDHLTLVPEPASLVLLLCAGFVGGLWHSRRSSGRRAI
jgi:hypothetical protein